MSHPGTPGDRVCVTGYKPRISPYYGSVELFWQSPTPDGSNDVKLAG